MPQGRKRKADEEDAASMAVATRRSRLADDDANTPNKETPKFRSKTKEQEIKEAKARARKWAAKYGVVTSPTTTTTPTRSSATKAKKKATPTSARRGGGRRSSSRGQAKPSKDDEVMEEVEEEEFVSPKKKRKLTHDDSKPSKSEQKLAAEAWAREQAAKKEAAKMKKAALAAAAASPPRQSRVAAAATSPPRSSTRSSTSSRRQTRSSEQDHVLEATPFSVSPSRAAKPKSPPKKTSPPKLSSPQSSPSPPGSPPPSEKSKRDENYEFDAEDEVDESSSPSAAWLSQTGNKLRTISGPFLKLVIIVLVAVLVAGILSKKHHVITGAMTSVTDWLTSVRTVPTDLPPCFMANAEQLMNDTGAKCDASEGERPCPEFGVCWGRLLRGCNKDYLQVAEKGDKCVLTLAANETLAALVKRLEDANVKERCNVGGCMDACEGAVFVDGIDEPMFSVSDRDLIDMIDKFSDDLVLVGTPDHGMLVGLSQEYLDQRLTLPLWCEMQGWFVMGLTVMFGTVVALGWSVVEYTWRLAVAHPWFFAAGVVVFWLLQRVLFKRRLLNRIASARDKAYRILCRDTTRGHQVLHVRDTVADETYPESRWKRGQFNIEIWPKVVSDVKKDNRVRKTITVTADGKTRDVWQWDAAMLHSPRQ